jgi:hypothetical protein
MTLPTAWRLNSHYRFHFQGTREAHYAWSISRQFARETKTNGDSGHKGNANGTLKADRSTSGEKVSGICGKHEKHWEILYVRKNAFGGLAVFTAGLARSVIASIELLRAQANRFHVPKDHPQRSQRYSGLHKSAPDRNFSGELRHPLQQSFTSVLRTTATGDERKRGTTMACATGSHLRQFSATCKDRR